MRVVAMDGKLTELVSRLKEAAGKNLESVILYGSAARGDFHPGASDLNVLCTLVSIDVNELHRLAPVVRWWTREAKEPAPLFFLTEELASSTDVFAIESLDAKRSHRVLFGKDVVADLEIPMNLHRVEVERDLRELLLKLRQHILHAGRNEMELSGVLKKTASMAKTLLRHTLLTFGEEPPAETKELFARIAAVTGADAAAFEDVYNYRTTGVWKKDSLHAYDDYMHALEKVIMALDTKIPKREWQRVEQGSQ
jgi:predicted nucleotidyltransferase